MLEWERACWLFASETECSAGWRLHYNCIILYFRVCGLKVAMAFHPCQREGPPSYEEESL